MLAQPRVRFVCNCIAIPLSQSGHVGSFGQVLMDKAVRVLCHPPLQRKLKPTRRTVDSPEGADLVQGSFALRAPLAWHAYCPEAKSDLPAGRKPNRDVQPSVGRIVCFA